MKKLLLAVALLNIFMFTNAQEYFTGKLIDNQGRANALSYDRTENSIGIYVFQTEYKVLSKASDLLYTITVTHDQLRSLLSVAVKTEGSNVKGEIIEYDENACGLIFSDFGNTDTVFDISKPYNYLISFTDVTRDYPVLHKIKTSTGEQIVLDPLNKFCLKKHIEIVKSHRVITYLAQKEQKMEDDNSSGDGYKGDLWGDKNINGGKRAHSFASQMLKSRDTLYIKNNLYTQYAAQLRADIDKDLKTVLKENQTKDNVKKYEGEKKRGKPEGKGILVNEGEVFDGKFEKGMFMSGTVIIKEDSGEYCGEYSNDYMNGAGVLKYKNGNYFLGKFRNGRFAEGIIFAKDKGGEIFLGACVYNQRTGYGELRSPGGSFYYGEFKNGRLVKGYSKEVDQFGYSTYSKIDNGTKKTIDPQQAKYFFAEALSLKK